MQAVRRTYISGTFHVLDESHHAGYVMAQYHYHAPFEIFVLTSGQAKFWVDGDLYDMRPGELIIFPSGVPHKIHVETPINDLAFHFSEDYIRECFSPKIAQKLLQPLQVCRIVQLSDEDIVSLRRLVDAMLRTPGWEYLCLGQLIRILTLANGTGKKKKRSEALGYEAPDRFSRIIQFVNDHYASMTSLADICDRFDIPESSLCRLFRQKLDMTPTEYINRLKVDYACNRLIESGRTVFVVAQESGFESSSYFVRTFKRYMNCTPTEYREKNRQHLSLRRQYVDGSPSAVMFTKPSEAPDAGFHDVAFGGGTGAKVPAAPATAPSFPPTLPPAPPPARPA